MNFLRKNLANCFTLANLFFGCVGIIELLSGNYEHTLFCLVMSLLLDFLDGFVARATRTSSLLGGQLDSLADMVSFGFLPGVSLYLALSGFSFFVADFHIELKYFGLLITVFSCLRLAIFNLDDDQTYYFKGLNTPTNTLFIFSLYYLYKSQNAFAFLMESPFLLLLLTLVFSLLLVSSTKMIALKFKSKKLEDHYPKLALLIGIILLFIAFQARAVPLSVLYYIGISLVFQKQIK